MPGQESTSRVERFTKSNVRALLRDTPAGRKITEAASPLTLKATTAGGQWIVVKKLGGKVRTFTPKTPDGTTIANTALVWPPEQARNWAIGVVGSLAKGEAPLPARKPAGTTFAALAEDHLADYARRAQPSSVVDRRYGISYALPTLGKLQVTEIGIEHALALRDAFSGSPSKATKAWIAATEILALALARGLVQANPFKAVKAPERPQSRDRHPSLAELARIEASAVADGSVGADLVRFVFRTGLRVQAAASLQWSEVDLDHAELRLAPSAGRKFKRTLRLPLGASAVELLRKTPRTDGTDLVFPGRDRHGQPAQFRSWTALYNRLRKASGVVDWSAHDFRRALVSLTAEHRPDINVVALDRLLGHTGGGTLGTVAGVYQRSSMMGQMREAVDAWDQLLRGALA